MDSDIKLIINNIKAFETEAHNILSIHESTKSRTIILSNTYKKLLQLSIYQENLFKESFECVLNDLFRSAHVMAWAAFIDFIENLLVEKYLNQLKLLNPKLNIDTVEDLREDLTEFSIIRNARNVGLLSKSQEKALHGLLSTRNECAHPDYYSPGLNETLGYISELLNRIDFLKNK